MVFVTNVAFLNIETIKLVYKPLDIYLLKYAKNDYVCEKGNIDTEEEADKVCSKVQRTFDNAVGKLPTVSYFNTKTNLNALNYAQDFGTI